MNHPIIFYDGVCGLCNRTVQFILRHDKKAKFRFATLGSAFAVQTLGAGHTLDSFVYFSNGTAKYRSSAALYMLKELSGIWQVCFIFILVPPFIRDAVYNWVARNRYKWFGKYDSCPIPPPDQRKRFIALDDVHGQ